MIKSIGCMQTVVPKTSTWRVGLTGGSAIDKRKHTGLTRRSSVRGVVLSIYRHEAAKTSIVPRDRIWPLLHISYFIHSLHVMRRIMDKTYHSDEAGAQIRLELDFCHDFCISSSNRWHSKSDMWTQRAGGDVETALMRLLTSDSNPLPKDMCHNI